MAELPSPAATTTLTVTRKDEIARGIDLFELRRSDGGELPQFTAGAHIALVQIYSATRPMWWRVIANRCHCGRMRSKCFGD